jgi:hypothetical protein
MPLSRETMVGTIFVTLSLMLALAALSLRRRRLTLGQYLACGLVALLLPALGPFLVIAYPPRQRPAPLRIPEDEPARPRRRRRIRRQV